MSNFTVKPYKTDDKYKQVKIDNQLIFSLDTKMKEVPESAIEFPNEAFDFYDHSELDELRKNTVYLTGMHIHILHH